MLSGMLCQMYSVLVLAFSFLGNKAEEGTREFIKAAVGAGEFGRRKETNGRAAEEERTWVGHQVELVLDRMCSCAHLEHKEIVQVAVVGCIYLGFGGLAHSSQGAEALVLLLLFVPGGKFLFVTDVPPWVLLYNAMVL